MSDTTRRILLWTGVTLGLFLLVFGLAKLGAPSSPVSSTNLNPPVTAADHIQGLDDAKVTVVEYSDFQCPACGAFYPALKRLAQDYPKDVRLVFRNFPLNTIHPNAQLAAQAAEAAGLQGKFWEMHDLLFINQSLWAKQDKPQDTFVAYAKSLGMNTDQFQKDLTSEQMVKAVAAHVESGNAMQINSTPTIFMNGVNTPIPNSYEALQALVNKQITQ